MLANELKRVKWIVRALVAAGAVLAVLAGSIAFRGASPPFTGRLAWVEELLFNMVGPSGPAIIWLGFAFVCFGTARFLWRHAPRRPGDRWL